VKGSAPTHAHRRRQHGFSDKTRLGLAVKSYERQNAPVKITLKKPPWAGKPKPTLKT